MTNTETVIRQFNEAFQLRAPEKLVDIIADDCVMEAIQPGTMAERFIQMENAERSPTFYRFDSHEQFRVWRDMDDRDEEPVVVYHSHTATEAYPSRTDVRYASQPDAHYVLVSTRDPAKTEFRSFRIVDESRNNSNVESRQNRFCLAIRPNPYSN